MAKLPKDFDVLGNKTENNSSINGLIDSFYRIKKF